MKELLIKIYHLSSKIFRELLAKYFTIIVLIKCKKYAGPVKVNRRSIVTRNTYLGQNVNFNGIEILGKGKVQIGNNFHSGKECMIITEFHKFDGGDAIPYDTKDNILKDVIIEDNVWIGNRVIILGGVTISEGAIIQAGSVVVNSIPKYGIAGGHPANVFATRNIESYEKLKNMKKFV